MTKRHILCVFLMVYIVFLDREQDILMEHSVPDAFKSRFITINVNHTFHTALPFVQC